MPRHDISIKIVRAALRALCTPQNAVAVATKGRGALLGTRLSPTQDKDRKLESRFDCGVVLDNGTRIQIKMQANKNAEEPSVSKAADLVHDVAVAVWDTEKDPDMIQLHADLEKSFEEIKETPKGQKPRSSSQSSQGKADKGNSSRSKSKSPNRGRSESPTGGKGGSKG